MRSTLFSSFITAVALGLSLPAQETARPTDVFPVPGTDALVRVWSVGGVDKSAFSRDGGRTWVPLQDQDYQLRIRSRSFDPAIGDKDVPPLLMAQNDNNLFYVQFKTDIIPEYLEALESLGVEAARYYPSQAYVVRMSRAMVEIVADQPFVRAVADVHTAYKLDEAIIADLAAGVSGTTDRYNVMLLNKRTDEAPLVAHIANIGGTIVDGAKGGTLVIADLTLAQVMQVAQHKTVIWIDRYGPGEEDIDLARIQAGVDYTEGGIGNGGFGKGISGHIAEGIHATHTEFAAIAPYRTAPTGVETPTGGMYGTSSTSHGTNTAGEIYARGASALYKGMLPFAQAYHTNYSQSIINTNNRYPMTGVLQDPMKRYRVLIQTASWGYPRTTTYTTRSAEMDDILFDFPRLYVTNSQSNSGSIPSRPQAWAKNVAGIGGFNHGNNLDPTDDCHCNTGSTGPADDGRVGVSFAAYYDSIRTTSGSTGYSTSFGGTSGATPIVNGLSGAVIEMHTDGMFGYPAAQLVGGVPDRFSIRPNLTTTRVLLTLGTRQLSFTGSRNAIRVEQGWGFPNLQDIYDNRDNILVLDEEDVLQTGDTRTYYVWVKPGTTEFRASMHHLEDEAIPGQRPHRINSLDLRVVAADGSTYLGNVGGIMTGPYSTPVPTTGESPQPNDIDIHENVFIVKPPSGVYSVSVNATAVRADQHRETPEMDVDFALAVRGIGGGRDRSGMLLDLVSDSAGQFDVALSNLPGGWTTGYTLLSTATQRFVSLGNLFGVEADALTLASLLSAPVPGGLFAFTNTGGPSEYPSSTFNFPAPVALAVQGLTFDGTAIVFDASGNVLGVSNVDRVTVQ